MIKTAKELATAAESVAKNYKTLYVMGCFGAPMTDKNKTRYTKNCAYNKNESRVAMIRSASSDTFGFDCVCFIKGLLWDWKGDPNHVYGGAAYKSNGVPDISADKMITVCSDVSTDFSNIAVGEMVWMKGHCGIYIGNGLAVEATPKWDNKVQITACNCDKPGYNRRDWTKHGKLPYVEYTQENEKSEDVYTMNMRMLKKGHKGEDVRALQILLIGRGYSCGSYGADGDFGSATDSAVRKYQADKKLEVDGIVGSATMGSLLGV